MIKIEHLYKTFGKHIIFDDFSMEIHKGEFVILTGPSGCGKTTLLNMIGSIEPISDGRILVDEKNINNKKNQRLYFRDKVGFLFQNFALIENMTVDENMKIVRIKAQSGITINEALKNVGLDEKRNQKVYELSGGEQQRIALARLMYKKCDIILADEPTGSLDRKNAVLVMEILKSMNNQGKTIIMVTHDNSLLSYGTRIVELKKH